MQQVHNDNVLIKWCKEQGYMITFKENAPKVDETHLLLNGGRILIPDNAYEKFMAKMAEAIMREAAWLYVVEKKTNPGRFFLELDLLLWDKRLTREEILAVLVPPFSRVMRAAYPGHDIMAVICTAPPIVVERVSFFLFFVEINRSQGRGSQTGDAGRDDGTHHRHAREDQERHPYYLAQHLRESRYRVGPEGVAALRAHH
jgi:hypothetical protein